MKWLSFALLILVSCEVRRKEERPVIVGPSGKNIPSFFRLTISEQPDPMKYSVTLEWPSSGITSTLYRREGAKAPRRLSVISPDVGRYEDATVLGGGHYTYLLQKGEGELDERQNLGTIAVDVPQDLLIPGEVEIKEILGVRRLFLTEGARLRASEGQLRIEVEKLISEGAILESFAQGTKAKARIEARPSPIIYLKTKSATGSLHIIARGEDGADGVAGRTGQPGRPGTAGSDGSIVDKTAAPAALAGSIRRSLEQLESRVDPLSPEWQKVYGCDRAPTNGEDGSDGLPGFDGEPGSKGGESARVLVHIDDAEGLRLLPKVEVGRGGKGGAGGEGGAGGSGGAAGKRDRHHICPQAREGKPGKIGARGKEGDSGVSGERGPICLILGNTKAGDCDPASRFLPYHNF